MNKLVTRILSGLVAIVILFSAMPAQAKVFSGFTSKVDYDNTDTQRYKIEIDLINQIITVYENSGQGTYDKIILQGLCTTGSEENPTGAGNFRLGDLKERFGYFVAFGQYAQYWTQVIRGVYIHSVMYDKKNITTMSKSAYNNLGKPLSHGCVRVMPEHAQWIFYNCPPGTLCTITKNKAPNPELISQLKDKKPSYSKYVQPIDFKADPPAIPAMIRVDNVPLRTGFSTTNDTTVQTLSAGTIVSTLQIGSDWCKVETPKGKLGYVQTKYLQINPDQNVSSNTQYFAKEKSYLYSYPSTKASKLYTYTKGENVQIIGTVDVNWKTATLGGEYGFVRSNTLSTQKGEQAVPEAMEFERREARVKPTVIANMRSGPGTDYPVIMELAPNTTVVLTEDYGTWYGVIANGTEGFVSKVCF